MSDETNTTSEVARVLGEHPAWRFRAEEPGDWYVCSGSNCGVELETLRSAVQQEFYDHQAAMLAEAGLLDDAARPAGIERWEVALALTPYMDTQTRYRATADMWALITRMTLAQEAQIAAQEPAGGAQGGSGDSRTLADRLRAAADYQDRPGAYDELRAMADEVDRLEEALRSTTHQLELEQDDVCVAHGTVRPCRHCAYAASASEGTW